MVLPVDSLEKFAQVTIHYSRDHAIGQRDQSGATVNEAAPDGGYLNMSTRGLQAEIYDRIKSSYSVWSAYSNSRHVDRNRQDGQITLMLESRLKAPTWSKRRQHLADTLKKVEATLASRMAYLSFKSVDITPFPGTKIFISIKTTFNHRDEYVQWCKDEGNGIGLLGSEFELIESYTDTTVSGTVADRLRTCDGLLQFYMSNESYDDARWLEAEYFAARVLNKPRARILDERIRPKKLPVTDKDQASIKVRNPDEMTMREAIRKALIQLLDEISVMRVY